MPASPVPEFAPPPPAEQASPGMGSLFETYNPEGALGGMFAPAYIKGFAPSEAAVAQYYAPGSMGHRLSSAELDLTRMPAEYRPTTYSGGNGVYGGPLPMTQTYGDPRGMIDPDALRAAAQGGRPYDLEARRAAIAARLAANAAAQGQPAPAPIPLKGRGEPEPLSDEEERLRVRPPSFAYSGYSGF
jgi:hypothetical protein